MLSYNMHFLCTWSGRVTSANALNHFRCLDTHGTHAWREAGAKGKSLMKEPGLLQWFFQKPVNKKMKLNVDFSRSLDGRNVRPPLFAHTRHEMRFP
jgi:hypothetical protein